MSNSWKTDRKDLGYWSGKTFTKCLHTWSVCLWSSTNQMQVVSHPPGELHVVSSKAGVSKPVLLKGHLCRMEMSPSVSLCLGLHFTLKDIDCLFHFLFVMSICLTLTPQTTTEVTRTGQRDEFLTAVTGCWAGYL